MQTSWVFLLILLLLGRELWYLVYPYISGYTSQGNSLQTWATQLMCAHQQVASQKRLSPVWCATCLPTSPHVHRQRENPAESLICCQLPPRTISPGDRNDASGQAGRRTTAPQAQHCASSAPQLPSNVASPRWRPQAAVWSDQGGFLHARNELHEPSVKNMMGSGATAPEELHFSVPLGF